MSGLLKGQVTSIDSGTVTIRLQTQNNYVVSQMNIVDSQGQIASSITPGDIIHLYHSGETVQRLVWQAPILLSPLTELTSDPLINKIISQKYLYFRRLPPGPDSFYLAVTTAIAQFTMYPTIGVEFLKQFTDAVQTASRDFQPGESMQIPLEQAWQKISNLSAVCSLQDSNKQIGQWLADEELCEGLVYMSKLLIASALNQDRRSGTVGLLEDSDLSARILKVLHRDTSVDEIDIVYMATALNSKISIVSASTNFSTKTYNGDRTLAIHLYELSGNYYPLITQTEGLYFEYSASEIQKYSTAINSMSNTSLGQNQEVTSLKSQISMLQSNNATLQSDLEESTQELKNLVNVVEVLAPMLQQRVPKNNHPMAQEYFERTKVAADMLRSTGRISTNVIRGFDEIIASHHCAYCNEYRSTVKLECGHLICEDDLYEKITRETRGLVVLNDYEIQMELAKEAVCPVCSCKFDNRQALRSFLAKDKYMKLWEEALEREKTQNVVLIECNGCGQEVPEDQYFSSEWLECMHRCEDCTTDLVRHGATQCPQCNESYAKVTTYIKELSLKCCKCNKNRLVVKWFTHKKYCQTHGRLCIDCLSQAYRLKYCMVCEQDFSPEIVKELQQLMFLKCSRCHENYDKRDIINQKSCLCLICKDCQKDNLDSCAECNTPFPEPIKNHLEQYVKEQKDRALARDKECDICYDKHPIGETRMIPCGHYFGQECLKQMLEYYVSSKDTIEQVKKCPKVGCPGLLPAAMIQELMTPESFDKYNRFAISNEFNQVNCPRCDLSFEPWNNRRIQCMNRDCGYVFCKICNEAYHDTGDCLEIYIDRKMKGLEEYELTLPEDERSGISQCPGCREPYLMDKNRSLHMECINQDCKVLFCLVCCCLRSPTLAHGCHFHRPNCKFWTQEPDQTKDPDKVEWNYCSECKKLGRLCPRPKELRVPRRIALDEVLVRKD